METSFKAVVFDSGNRVLLGSSPRGEWELLGGRADPADGGPEDTVRRELREEAGLTVHVGKLIDIWYYDVPGDDRVAVASYVATADYFAQLSRGDEHVELAFFEPAELDQLNLPEAYKRTIRLAQSQ